MKQLSREEMKNVMGGYLYSGGQCTGSVGSWEMVPPTTGSGCLADIQRYCRSGSGTCTYTQSQP